MSASKLEEEFENVYRVIADKVAIANNALSDTSKHKMAVQMLNQANKLADEHGVPFHSKVVPIGNNFICHLENDYVPDTFFAKFQGLDPNEIARVTSVSAFALTRQSDIEEYSDDDEWQSSDPTC